MPRQYMLVAFIAKKVFGTKIKYKEHEINLAPPWQRITMYDAIKKYAGIDVSKMDLNRLNKFLSEKGLEATRIATKGDIIAAIFEQFAQPHLIQPTFVIDYPIEISPLAKKKKDNPELTERFEIFIGGEECGNGFSELNDPIDQRERFLEQAKRKQKGDVEAHPVDEDFIRSLEYGMPPTGGFGIGIERLTMILTNTHTIKDVILFPVLKPEENIKEKEQIFGDVTKTTALKHKKL